MRAGPAGRGGTMSGTCAITMAGFGSRFAAAGFGGPKYAIEALGLTLFEWSMAGLDTFAAEGWRFVFAMRRDDGGGPDLVRRLCARRGIVVGGIVELDAPTDGQATTALQLAGQCDAGLPFAVFNIDTFVRPGAMGPGMVPEGCDGWLPCFPGLGDAWSFARLGPDGGVAEVREKVRISAHATVGLYWFRSAGLYADAYRSYFGTGGREEKGERYVAPLYNQLIAEGRRVEIAALAEGDVGMLGTPAQVAAFIESPPAAARAMAGGAA